MENIEQLQEQNAKLTERLNNAAKFFREQKAQIESLTKENEELKNKIETLEYTSEDDAKNLGKANEYASQLEKYVKELEKSNNDLNEQVQQKLQQLKAFENTTNNEIKKLTEVRDSLINEKKELETKIQTIETKFKEQEKFVAETINIKLPELETENKKLKGEYDVLNEAVAKLKTDNESLIESNKKLTESNKKLNETCDELDNNSRFLEEQMDKYATFVKFIQDSMKNLND